MNTLVELGNQAYQKALWNDFKGAITILDKAIAKYPRDPRLYNNRCYSYCRLKDFKRSVEKVLILHFSSSPGIPQRSSNGGEEAR
ncbi:hypothetical protein J6590_036352 [Homalodisca vitripennis]|nr:hypothetical protein J6590_036352 [Homalodisca vitripennis]